MRVEEPLSFSVRLLLSIHRIMVAVDSDNRLRPEVPHAKIQRVWLGLGIFGLLGDEVSFIIEVHFAFILGHGVFDSLRPCGVLHQQFPEGDLNIRHLSQFKDEPGVGVILKERLDFGQELL